MQRIRVTLAMATLAGVVAALACTCVHAQEWRLGGKLTDGRHLFAAHPIGPDRILVLGGWGGSVQPGSGTPLASCEIIDLSRSSVFPAAAMNEARADFVATVTNDSNVVAIAGVTSVDGRLSDAVELYDRNSDTWRIVGRLIEARFAFMATAISATEIVVAGGKRNASTVLSTAEIFDLTTGTSRQIASLPGPIHSGAAAIASDGSILVFGGRSGGADSPRSPDVLRYESSSNEWKVVSALPNPGMFAPQVLTLWDGSLAVSGGGLNEDPQFHDDVLIAGGGIFNRIARLNEPRITHAMAQWDETSFLVLAGIDETGSRLNSSERLVNDGGWRREDGPALIERRHHARAVSLPRRDDDGAIVESCVALISGFQLVGNTTSIEVLRSSSASLPFIHDIEESCTNISFTVSDPDDLVTFLALIDPDNVEFTAEPDIFPASEVRVTINLIDPWIPSTFRLDIGNGAGETLSFSDLISNRIEPPPRILADKLGLCDGEVATLRLDGSYDSYLWSNGATTPSITTGIVGAYSVRVTAANGCVAQSSTVNITISERPLAPSLQALVPSSSRCEGDVIPLDAGEGFQQYRWYRDGVLLATTQTIDASSSGDYHVEVALGPGCFASSDTVTLAFNPDAIEVLELDGRRFDMNCGNATALHCVEIPMRNSGATRLDLFRGSSFWLFNNTEYSLPASQFAALKNIQPGDTFRLKVCYAPRHLRVASDELTINLNCRVQRILLQCNGMQRNDFQSEPEHNCQLALRARTVGFDNVILGSAIVQPNPASDRTELSFELPCNPDSLDLAPLCRVYDIFGRVVALGSLRFREDEIQAHGALRWVSYDMDVSHVPQGLYYALVTGNRGSFSVPLAVQR